MNGAGEMIIGWYREIENKFPDIKCDECVVMPHHLHAVIVIVGAGLCVCPKADMQVDTWEGEHAGSPLPTIVQWFKTMTTNDYIHGVKERGWSRFSGRLWQRNYGACPERSRRDRIIRNENELNRIREYLQNNPAKWADDPDNPLNWQ
jgi:REP element-mobilizing transposase RayT